jgi:integrase
MDVPQHDWWALRFGQSRRPDHKASAEGERSEVKGLHAFRRGRATNLHELGVPDIVIQPILRHEDVSRTERSYIKAVPQVRQRCHETT